jgi:hypothetical protein
MTWRDLAQPIYVMAFLEGFLIGIIPTGSLAHVAANGSAAAALTTAPTAWTVLGGVGVGLLNGIRFIRALATTPPERLGERHTGTRSASAALGADTKA